MGRATQGVRLINLEKRNDEIASVCKVLTDIEEEVEKLIPDINIEISDNDILDETTN